MSSNFSVVKEAVMVNNDIATTLTESEVFDVMSMIPVMEDAPTVSLESIRIFSTGTSYYIEAGEIDALVSSFEGSDALGCLNMVVEYYGSHNGGKMTKENTYIILDKDMNYKVMAENAQSPEVRLKLFNNVSLIREAMREGYQFVRRR